ncbi:MAG: SpoIIE family protein phosphatase [Spirochaetes bacterium]|nr:SpoIIE family protein phosphatase [Spirochaetota bacterium]
MDTARELLRSEGCSLLLYEPQSGDLVFDVVIGDKGDIIRGERVPSGKGIAGTVVATRKPEMVDDAQGDERWYRGIDKKYLFHTRNILCVPMMIQDELVGVLEVVNTLGRERYDEGDLEQAQYLAGQAAVAITTRRLHDDLNNRIEEITALYEVTQSISLATPDENLIDAICRALASSIKVRRASILLADEGEGGLHIESCYGLPDAVKPGHGINPEACIAGHVFKTGDPLIVTDIRREIPESMRREDGSYITDSFLAVPVRLANRIIGVICCADKINGGVFDSHDLRIVTTVSGQVSQAYGAMINQREKEQRRRLSHEIDVAAEIQRKILHDIPPSVGRHRLVAFNRPAKVVGGDFYDFYKLDRHSYSLLVADISGKGIPAALFMGLALNVVRAERRVESSPSELLHNANRYIHQDSENGMFVTLFYAVVDSRDSVIRYASAGHNDQFLLRAGNGEVKALNARGRALGLAPDQKFEERSLAYEKGDMLILFTDGVTECFGGDTLDIAAGEKELIRIVWEYLAAGPDEMMTRLKRRLEEAANPEFADDVTVVAVQF